MGKHGCGRRPARHIVQRQNAVAVLLDMGCTQKAISRTLNVPIKTIERDVVVLRAAGSPESPDAEAIRQRMMTFILSLYEDIEKLREERQRIAKRGITTTKRGSPSFDHFNVIKELTKDEDAPSRLIGKDGLVVIERIKKKLIPLDDSRLFAVQKDLIKLALAAYGFGNVKEKETTHVTERTETTKVLGVIFPEKLQTGQWEEAAEQFRQGKVPAVITLGEGSDAGSKNPQGK